MNPTSQTGRTGQTVVDRLPPWSEEAERGVLGCILLAPTECLTESANRLKSCAGAFYDLRHQRIFNSMLELQNRSVRVDLITVIQSLRDQHVLDECGGMMYLQTLPDAVPSAANLDSYLDIVFNKWLLRRMITTCTEAVARLYDGASEPTVAIAAVQCEVLGLPTATDSGPRQIGEYAGPLEDRLERYARGVGMITGLPTGYRYLDKCVCGMHPTEMFIIGGDPGSGKTSLAMNIAERVAVNGGNPVGILSLEMGAEDLTMRLVCSKTRVNFHKLRTGCATKEDLQIVRDAMPAVKDVKECPIYLDDSSGLTMYEVRSRLRAMKHRWNIRLAVVDYLQLVALTREQMYLGMAAGYADVARGLQQAAKELEIPIIVLSQLSNEGRKRGKNERPKLTDFRETGAIGDVANFAGILWRPALEKDKELEQRQAISADPMGNHVLAVQMEILKNKNGPAGMGVQFEFLRWCMRFEDVVYKEG